MTAAVRSFAACLFALLVGATGRTAAQPLSVPLSDLSGFRLAGDPWRIAGAAWTLWDSTALVVEPGTGVLVYQPGDGSGAPLLTDWTHGDLELELEFLLAAGSEPGLYLQGRYELHLSDSWGVERPRFSDAGGISRRSDTGFEGHPPRANASRAPGLWQHLRVVFEAPRFDASGQKAAPARFLQVVLNGVTVQENVVVAGPTQGAAFADEQPAGPLLLQGGRGAAAFRNIRYRHVEQAEPVRLADVRYRFYEGEFGSLSDLAAAEPARAGDAYGYVWDLFGTHADRFGATWEGVMHVPKSGPYDFTLGFNWIDEIPYEEDAVPGHGRLTIDGDVVVAHDGAEHLASGRVYLEAGAHPFSLTYFKNRRLWRPIVFFQVEGEGVPRQYLNAPRTLPEPETASPPMAVEPVREPYVLRSFVEYGGEKRVNAVSVGDPRGVHYTLDLETGGLLYAWKGIFADVGSMWHSRGERQVASPLGSCVRLAEGPALALLPDARAPWPASLDSSGYRFRGYGLDAEGRPTFRYTFGGVDVAERLVPGEDGRTLERRLDLSGAAPAGPVWLRAAEGASIRERRAGVYDVDGRYFVRLAARGAVVRARNGRQELLVPARFASGTAAVTYEIIW